MTRLLESVRQRRAGALAQGSARAPSDRLGTSSSGRRSIRHPAFPNLEVIPYLRGRLVFAQHVAVAMAQDRFDLVLDDLPAFMGGNGWLAGQLSAFPLVSSLLVCLDDGSYRLLALTPTDAGCVAAYLAMRDSIALECIGDGHELAHSGPDSPRVLPALAHDGIAEEKGLEAYFGPVWRRLDSLPEPVSGGGPGAAGDHVPALLSRLSQARAGGAKTLLVCEHRLWWRVRRAIDEGRRAPGPEPAEAVWPEAPALSLLEDPYQLWAAGHLDDCPAVSHRFFLRLREGDPASFSKKRALLELLEECLSESSGGSEGRSGRSRADAFETRLRGMLDSSSGSMPLPATQLLESARECRGRDFARAVARAVLSYPYPTSPELAAHPPAAYLISRTGMVPADLNLQIPDALNAPMYYELSSSERALFFPEAEEKARKQWAGAVRPFISRQEARLLKERGAGVRWAAKRDYRIRAAACSLVRQAGGRDRRRIGALFSVQPDQFTPVVFLFTRDPIGNGHIVTVHDSNPAQRALERQGRIPSPASPPDMVYSVAGIATGTEPVMRPHIEKDNLDALALLYTGEETGVERYAVINGRPKSYQCRISPDADSSLNGFALPEIVFAWAVKHAEKVVYGVVPRGWKPSQQLLKFAARRKKVIRWLRLDILPAEMIRDLRAMHFTSTALRDHPDYESIVARFVGGGG